MKNNKTTKKHFEIFKEECGKWIEVFGLKGWEVFIEHKVKSNDCRADCSYDVVGRIITLGLSPDWGKEEITEVLIRKAAFHEVCELLMCNIRTLARTRFLTSVEIDEEVHVVIRTLENVLFDNN